ncbi:MAG: D-2-hydroxyacid dehydrogenase [bacterium]|nr:D-2-hydroxyacid dehydrogenase [bacterium]MDT8396384.1 D-2-hydroxyacid dehydrogenase [bacterium]
MKIVVLDGYTLNPGDLSWEGLGKLGEVTVHDRTSPDELMDRAVGAEVLLTNKVILDAEAITNLPDLKYVGVLATGYNVVDLEAAAQSGIAVTNVPAYSTDSVAQMVFALLLELINGVGRHSRSVRSGIWSKSPDFSFHEIPLVELSGLTIGIVGYGAIGQGVARIARAMGMKVLVHTRTPGSEEGVQYLDLDTLFNESDVVSLHCPLTDKTVGIVNRERLTRMKPSAFLINTARGPLVDEQALADALNAGALAGAGLDVLSVEPPPPGNPLLSARNCVITPHIAWATKAARGRLMGTVVSNLEAWMDGRPVNTVS